MLEKLQEIENKFDGIEQSLMDPSISSNPQELMKLGKARAELEDVVTAFRKYKLVQKELAETESLLDDPEMRALASEELPRLRTELESLGDALRKMLIPKDPFDDRAVIVEIRPAAGGDEASLFAAELGRMYMRYAERRRWKVEVIEHEEIGIGGVSRMTFKIDANGAYSQLKHESGVHRVQRVPATENQGRIHTSTVTVAVLPEAEAVDVQVKNDDLEISTFCSSSAGGQHMQKNETAIRIIHKPTGIVVTCQDERSQAQNKLKAMEVLLAKVFQLEQEKKAAEMGSLRKGQVGSGDRSEKIRTYNFPQSRVTDHRIGMDNFNILGFMDGDIQPMIEALVADDQARKLAAEGDAA